MSVSDPLSRASALISARKFDEAGVLIQGVLKQQPRLARAHFLQGQIHMLNGRLGPALQAATVAYQIEPNSAPIAAMLAEIYLDLNLPEHALPVLEVASRKISDNPGLTYNFGRCYLLLEKAHKALPYFQSLLPKLGQTPEAAKVKLRLFECYSAIGENEKSDAMLDDLLEADPDNRGVLIKRGLAVTGAPPTWLREKLIQLADDPKASSEQRSDAWLALGRIADQEKKHSEAFQYWTTSRQLLGVQRHRGDQIKLQNFQVSQFYSKQLFQSVEQFGDHQTRPIFVVGMPRSGTTLAAQILGAHPACINIGETDRIGPYDIQFRKDHWKETGHRDIQREAAAGSFHRIAKEFNTFFNAFAEGEKTRIVEKSPINFECVGFIRLIYPRACFIHCRRHPADNFVSAFQQNMNRRHDYSYSQESYVERYLAQEEIMRHWKSCFPDQIFELRYENIIANTETVTRKLVAFCGLPWDDACLRFHEQNNTVRTFSNTQVRKPIYTSSVERWRKYENFLGPLFAKLGEQNYDYERSQI